MITAVRLTLAKTKYLECGIQSEDTLIVEGMQLSKPTNFNYLEY